MDTDNMMYNSIAPLSKKMTDEVNFYHLKSKNRERVIIKTTPLSGGKFTLYVYYEENDLSGEELAMDIYRKATELMTQGDTFAQALTHDFGI